MKTMSSQSINHLFYLKIEVNILVTRLEEVTSVKNNELLITINILKDRIKEIEQGLNKTKGY
tara:strand:- start:2678 stop:2863 length:186 start_codon:yes stop_codon:yes gene_type:complete